MNFKHLHYFWVTARAGGVVRAGQQLHTTPQTLSGQIKLLEERLGCKLFRKRGRNLELTDDGRAALRYADEIFQLGGELERELRQAGRGPRALDFAVGVADSVPKSLASRLLQPVFGMPERVKLICHEGKFDDLLARMVLHKLDLVIADEPIPRQAGIRAYNHALGATGVSFFCTKALRAGLAAPFPKGLEDAPMLLPGAASPARKRLDAWLDQQMLRPRIVGEFDDQALMKAFGRDGRGVFPAPTVLEAEIQSQYGVQLLGRAPDLIDEYFAVSVERRITHPCVVAIRSAARDEVFGG
jgi:LysR family transcriptional regulator, transcriptional activator of nhaA